MDEPTTVFELRTYTPTPGKLEALEARFRDHTIAIFARHGIGVVGFWLTADEDVETRLVYLLRFPSRAAATASWESFRNDPEWIAARTASEVDGSLVEHSESLFLTTTDYSPTI